MHNTETHLIGFFLREQNGYSIMEALIPYGRVGARTAELTGI